MQTKNKGSYEELDVASSGLKSAGVRVYSLGIGKNVDRSELVSIASDPDFAFQAETFKALQDMVLDIKKGVCAGNHLNYLI